MTKDRHMIGREEMTLKRQYLTGGITWLQAMSRLEGDYGACRERVAQWDQEKLEMAREDPQTLVRAVALATSNCGMSVVERMKEDYAMLLTLISHWWGGLIEGQWFEGCDTPEWRGKLESYAENVMARETISWIDRLVPYMGKPLPEYWADIGNLVDSLDEQDFKACAQRAKEWVKWDPEPVLDPWEERFGVIERVVLVEG